METTSRGLRRAVETCADKSAASGGDSGAHWAQGRALLNRKLFLCPRARFEIQTDVQTEQCARKTVRAKHEVWCSEVSRESILNSSF